MLHPNASNILGVPNSNSSSNNKNNANCNFNVNSYKNNNNNSNHNSNMQQCSNPLDALPKQFVLSMKKLFDILDDQHTGYVKLSDIEKGWQDDGSKGLPPGVIESLRKVTPPNSGLLSFERFCAGLKLSLLRNQQQTTNNNDSNISKTPQHKLQARPPSAPLLEIETPLPAAPIVAVRPRSHAPTMSAQRAISMPQLSPDSDLDTDFMLTSSCAATGNNKYISPAPPPKPPRASALLANGNANCVTTNTLLMQNQVGVGHLDKAEIRHALQNWQMNILLNELDVKDKLNSSHPINQNHTQFDYRGSADGGSSSATDSYAGAGVGASQAKKNISKRREPRRHTLQNGIDYNMLKRLKQYEEARELLLMGLDGVEKARDWYMQQVLNVQEKIKYFGRMGTNFEQYSEAQQERLNYQRARVLEVNRSLSNLVNTWDRGGYPHHINLALRTAANKLQTSHYKRYSSGNNLSLANPGRGNALVTENTLLAAGSERLREQNRQLTNELNMKSERIALLESEKQTLINEMYELQQRFGEMHNQRNTISTFVLSQTSPVSQSSGGLGDADVVY